MRRARVGTIPRDRFPVDPGIHSVSATVSCYTVGKVKAVSPLSSLERPSPWEAAEGAVAGLIAKGDGRARVESLPL